MAPRRSIRDARLKKTHHMMTAPGQSRKGKRVVEKLVELARRLRPPKKEIAYAVGKVIAGLWAAVLLKRPSFDIRSLSEHDFIDMNI